jgi:uncharacterized protein (DUF736 family)
MAQIGTFTRVEDGSYAGTIKTLSLNIKRASFRLNSPRTIRLRICA